MLRALGFPGSKSDSASDGDIAEISDDQPRNTFTELQLLDRHTDIIRHLAKIDHSRFVSAGDDGSVVFWETETGRSVHAIDRRSQPPGHTRRVTSVLLLPSVSTLVSSASHDSAAAAAATAGLPLGGESIQTPVPAGLVPDWLVTASSDKTIQMWSIDTGKHHRTLHAGGSVKCLVPLFQGAMFCSAGHSISIWSNDGDLVSNCGRPKADSDIHTVVPIRGNRLVVASDRPSLSVYNVDQRTTQSNRLNVTFFRMLQPHRESIRCLVAVSDAMLASSSLDGMIVLWSTLSLNPMRKFNEHEKYRDQQHCYPHCVNHLVALEGRYLLAAIATGFCMFDAIVALCVVKRTRAHLSNVNHMEFVAGGSMLSTSSEDGMIRLWSISSSDSADEALKPVGVTSPVETFMGERDLVSHRKSAKPITPVLVGQLAGHSGAVQRLLDLSPNGFASCSSDHLVILWKHGVNESQKRDEAVRSFLRAACDGEHAGSSTSPSADTRSAVFDSSIF
eukprot:scpid75911/ scgid9822/ WD repeat-containing protein 41